MFDSGIRTKTTTQRWCFPDRSSNLALAACVFQQWFLIALHDTDISRQPGRDRQSACTKPCNHMKWDLLLIKTTCGGDSSPTSAEGKQYCHRASSQTSRGNLRRISNFAHFPHLRSAVTPHREESGTFPDSGGRSSQLSCCRPSVTW